MTQDAHYTLDWQGLDLWRGDRCLQTGLSGVVSSGQAVCLRGPNGCGKTTLLRTLCGLSEAEAGEIRWQQTPIRANRPLLHAELAYAGHQTGLKGELTPRENLRFWAALESAATQPAQVEPLLMGLQLEHCADIPARNLSAGQQRRAALARVLGSGKRLWVLDEPFSNLDETGRAWLTKQFAQHLSGGGLLLLAAHQDTGLDAGCETVVQLAGLQA